MQTSLFGYGKTTRALAKKLKGKIVFYDDKCHKPFCSDEGYMVRPSFDFEPAYSDLEIPSPGIAPTNALICRAKNLMSEYDYFASSMPPSVWISGTNGKTTTTQMIHHLLQDKGAVTGGNIGTPLAQLDEEAGLWILETSSFTLHYTNMAKPDIYVLLPVREDHISWHGDFEAYEAAKLKPLSMMEEGDIAIVPKKYESVQSDAMTIGYEDVNDLCDRFEIDKDRLIFEGAFLFDAVLALAVEKILFGTLSYEKMNTFILDAHRQEELYDSYGRLWVNDTKATNVDATIAALKRYQGKKIHLILGGDDKGMELSGLFAYLKELDVVTYHIGSNKKRLGQIAESFGIVYHECANLHAAQEKIATVLKKGEVALLSPAAASLDEYTSYAKRGEEFKEFVHSLGC